MAADKTTTKDRWADRNLLLERHEAKYLIPRALVPRIREFIRPFCIPDPYTRGDPPEYVITTLQLDSPDLVLHHMKEWEALNRFKLRVRTYGTDGRAPVFLEVKRKVKGVIIKSRVAIPASEWGESLVRDPRISLRIRREKEVHGLLEFVRLCREINAQPVVWLRYTRESYMGMIDHYARVTLDRNLLYQPAKDWDSWGRGGKWRCMDSTLSQNKQYGFSGVVLELKTLTDAPQWMVDLTKELGLVRTGNCKYSTAVWTESIFRGTPAMPAYASEVFRT